MTSDDVSPAADLRRQALGLPGTTEAPRFDRTAFRVRLIYAKLPQDGLTAELGLSPEEQAHWCALLPSALRPVPNKWGGPGLDRSHARPARSGRALVSAPVGMADRLRHLPEFDWRSAEGKERSG